MRQVESAFIDVVDSQASWKTVEPAQQIFTLLDGEFEELSRALRIRYTVGVPVIRQKLIAVVASRLQILPDGSHVCT